MSKTMTTPQKVVRTIESKIYVSYHEHGIPCPHLLTCWRRSPRFRAQGYLSFAIQVPGQQSSIAVRFSSLRERHPLSDINCHKLHFMLT